MQPTLQEKEKNKKQMIALVFLILTILVGFFFTMDQGYSYIEKKDTLEITKKEAVEKKSALEKLQVMAKNIESSSEIQSDVEHYGSNFREDSIIDSLFAPISGISIAGISMGKWEKSPNGLSIANISLSLKAENIDSLGKFLDYLTNSKNNKKSYIIKSLNFPLDTTKNEAFAVTLELGMYYFN